MRSARKLAVLLAVGVVALGVGSAAPAAGVAPPRGEDRVVSVSCASKSVCRATVRSGLVESWNGHRWKPGFQFTDANNLDAISCPTTTFCAAVETLRVSGHYLYRPVTRDADGTWNTSATARAVPSGFAYSAPSVSCTSARFCMYVNSGRDYQRWNGTSWTAPVVFSAADVSTMVSCASTTVCTAVDNTHPAKGRRPLYTWNGSSWSSRRVLPALGNLLDLSCPSVSFCMLILGRTYLTVSGTHVSAGKHVPHRIGYRGLSCTSASFCIGTNGKADGSNRWDGRQWSGPHELAGQTDLETSCSGASFCVAVSFQKKALDRVNGTWQAPRNVEN